MTAMWKSKETTFAVCTHPRGAVGGGGGGGFHSIPVQCVADAVLLSAVRADTEPSNSQNECVVSEQHYFARESRRSFARHGEEAARVRGH